MAKEKEFPGYYVVDGKKIRPDGQPYRSGKEDDPAEDTPEQSEIRALRAELEALRAEKSGDGPAAPAPAAAPKAPEPTAKPAAGPATAPKVPGKS